MTDYTLCKIVPVSSFHLGSKEGLESTYSRVFSDTLFSAVCNAYRLLYGNKELEDLLLKFKQDPPFLISSTFPFLKETLLFPMPKHIDLSRFTVETKIFKNVKFVSEEIFKKIIENKNISKYLNEGNLAQHGKVLLVPNDVERYKNMYTYNGDKKELLIWSQKEVPRVTIDRTSNISNIYHFSETSFRKECGLFFIIDFKNNSAKEKIKASIRLLADEGIGGDRTSGKGLFKIGEPEFTTYSIKQSDGNIYTTMSLYFPTKGEAQHLKGYFELITRRGWIFSPDGRNMRRKTIRMFTEGSVFNFELEGGLVNVKPEEFKEHEVYRYGFAFPVRMEGDI